MKIWLSIFLTFMISTMALAQNIDLAQEVVFYSSTRGYSEKIRLTKDSIFREEQGIRGNTRLALAMPADQWKNLLELLERLPLNKINELPSPTNKRQSDGALHSRLTVVMKDKTYTSTEFDGYSPPKLLDPLMQLILDLSKKE